MQSFCYLSRFVFLEIYSSKAVTEEGLLICADSFVQYILSEFCLDRTSWYFAEKIGINLLIELFDVFATPCNKMVHFWLVSLVQHWQSVGAQESCGSKKDTLVSSTLLYFVLLKLTIFHLTYQDRVGL
jgi:hypothetical protein